jgi:hypothetical protein
MANKLANRVRVYTATTGTGDLTLGAAVQDAALGDSFTFSEAGINDGDVVSYVLFEGHNVEEGTGTYSSTGPTLVRTTVVQSKIAGVAGTSNINLTGGGQVFISPLASDLAPTGLPHSQNVTTGASLTHVDPLLGTTILVTSGGTGGNETLIVDDLPSRDYAGTAITVKLVAKGNVSDAVRVYRQNTSRSIDAYVDSGDLIGGFVPGYAELASVNNRVPLVWDGTRWSLRTTDITIVNNSAQFVRAAFFVPPLGSSAPGFLERVPGSSVPQWVAPFFMPGVNSSPGDGSQPYGDGLYLTSSSPSSFSMYWPTLFSGNFANGIGKRFLVINQSGSSRTFLTQAFGFFQSLLDRNGNNSLGTSFSFPNNAWVVLQADGANDAWRVVEWSSSLASTVGRPNTTPWNSNSADPTAGTGVGQLDAGQVGVWKNTTSGAVKLWVNDGGTLKSDLSPPPEGQRIPLTEDAVIWFRTDGDDANDGSANDSAHAFATVQAAIDYACGTFDFGNYQMTIRFGNAGTFKGVGDKTVFLRNYTGTLPPILEAVYTPFPNSGTSPPSGYIIDSDDGPALLSDGTLKWRVRGFKIGGSAQAWAGLDVRNGSVVETDQMVYGSVSNGYAHIHIQNASVICLGWVWVDAGAKAHVECVGGIADYNGDQDAYSNVTLNLPAGTTSFLSGFFRCSQAGTVLAQNLEYNTFGSSFITGPSEVLSEFSTVDWRGLDGVDVLPVSQPKQDYSTIPPDTDPGVFGALWYYANFGDYTLTPRISGGFIAISLTGSPNADEGDDINFTITRTSPGWGESSVDWVVTPTGATSPAVTAADFGGTFPSGTVTWAPGETSQTITVTPTDEGLTEPHEYFKIALSNFVGCQPTGVSNTAQGKINGVAGDVVYSSDTLVQNEGGSFVFTVTRAGPLSGTSSVDWAVDVSGVSDPVDGDDFVGAVLPSGTLTFLAGEASQTITIDTNDDSDEEPAENFNVVLSNPTSCTIGTNTATGQIAASDTPAPWVWNSADKSSDIALSVGDTVATATAGGWHLVRADSGDGGSGKWYFRAQKADTSQCILGLTNAGTGPDSYIPGSNTGSVGLIFSPQQVFYNFSFGDTIGSATAVTEFAWDRGANLYWFRVVGGDWNGNPSANPATGAGGISITTFSGTLYPTFASFSSGAGCTALPGSPPSGFTEIG